MQPLLGNPTRARTVFLACVGSPSHAPTTCSRSVSRDARAGQSELPSCSAAPWTEVTTTIADSTCVELLRGFDFRPGVQHGKEPYGLLGVKATVLGLCHPWRSWCRPGCDSPTRTTQHGASHGRKHRRVARCTGFFVISKDRCWGRHPQGDDERRLVVPKVAAANEESALPASTGHVPTNGFGLRSENSAQGSTAWFAMPNSVASIRRRSFRMVRKVPPVSDSGAA